MPTDAVVISLYWNQQHTHCLLSLFSGSSEAMIDVSQQVVGLSMQTSIDSMLDEHKFLEDMIISLKRYMNTGDLSDRETYNVREQIFHLENSAWVLNRRIREYCSE